MTRFRFGLLLGFGAGYVLGTKAGRERYEELRDTWHGLMGTEPARKMRADLHEVAGQAGEAIEQAATEGVDKVTGMIRREQQPAGSRPGDGSGGQGVPAF